MKPKMPAELRQFFVDAGRTGGKKAHSKRTKAQKKALASKAAKARWAKANKKSK